MPKADEPGPDESEQLRLMQRLVELSVERTRLAAKRNEMSADRSRMSADRSRMSAQRSEMSAERTYLNAERTLSVWIRTALAVMVVGIAVDRFGLVLLEQPTTAHPHDTSSTWVGAALVALGVLMAVLTGARFGRYAATYRRTHTVPDHHGPFLAPMFAALVAGFGVALFVLLLVSPG